jgi:hypothetical protein
VIEQALQALGDTWTVRPLPFVPDDEKGLDGVGALVIDDPSGFSPEARATLSRFLSRGGVAATLLGPRSAATALGWTLEPFGRGAARWEQAPAAHRHGVPRVARPGGDEPRIDWPLRARALDGMEPARAPAGAGPTAALLLERAAGRGFAVTAGYPSLKRATSPARLHRDPRSSAAPGSAA